MSTNHIIAEWENFKEFLEDDAIKPEFEEFLAENNITVSAEGTFFEAVLDFIRDDETTLSQIA